MSGLKREKSLNRSISITEDRFEVYEKASIYVDRCIEGIARDDKIGSFSDLVFYALLDYLSQRMTSVDVLKSKFKEN